MPDEDLLIGQPKEPPAQGATGIQQPMDLVNVSVFGVFKDSEKKNPADPAEEYVEQKFATKVPRGEPDDNIAEFIWKLKFITQAALKAVGSAGEVNYYPLDRFKRFTIKVGHVHGVTL
jgi:hypothetical protein